MAASHRARAPSGGKVTRNGGVIPHVLGRQIDFPVLDLDQNVSPSLSIPAQQNGFEVAKPEKKCISGYLNVIGDSNRNSTFFLGHIGGLVKSLLSEQD